VLHGRVTRIVGTPEPQASDGYADRTPPIDDPDAARLAGELAVTMDERVSLLGWRATVDRPPWAVRYLGAVPADPADRAEWTRRGGLAAAYREESGYAHDTDPIGPAMLPNRHTSTRQPLLLIVLAWSITAFLARSALPMFQRV
jgi:hypothetical protein